MKFKLGIISKIITLSIVVFMTTVTAANAHENQNVESHGEGLFGTGKIHYHHGYEAHQHPKGRCKFREEESRRLGIKDGKEDGFSGQEKLQYRYSKEYAYFAVYKKSYDEAFGESKKTLNQKKEEAWELGYDVGKGGKCESATNAYDNEIVKQTYLQANKQGYHEFRIEEYYRAGFEDGINNIGQIALENLEEDYSNSYKKGYEEGKNKYIKSIKDEGYNAAFGNGKAKSSYSEEEQVWYDEGFTQGQKDLDELEKTAYNLGKNGGSKTVPEKFKHAQDIFDEQYEKGVAAKKKEEGQIASSNERKKKMEMVLLIGTGLIVLAPIGFILKSKANKKKIDNQLGEDDKVA